MTNITKVEEKKNWVSYHHPLYSDPDPGFEVNADPDPGLDFLQKFVFLYEKSEKRTLALDPNVDLDPDSGTPKMQMQIRNLE